MGIKTNKSEINTRAIDLKTWLRTGTSDAGVSEGDLTPTTWNSADKGGNITLSNGDLTAAGNTSGWNQVRSVYSASSGKYYWEITMDSGNQCPLGIATSASNLSSFTGCDQYSWAYYTSNGYKYTNNDGGASYGDSFTAGDVIGVALDVDNNKLWWSKNGTWQNSGDPAAGTNEAYSGLTGTYHAALGLGYSSATTITANFGASAFSYSVPSGFTAGFG